MTYTPQFQETAADRERREACEARNVVLDAAVRKANALPKPLTKAQRKIVAERDEAVAAKLPDLVAAFAKPERKRDEPKVKSKDSNGWTR